MNLYKKIINKTIYLFLLNVINLYQKIISPILPARCRYYPTCSNYGKQAIAWHGVWPGSLLLIKRLGRCQPWGGHGIDFVPVPLASYDYKPFHPSLTGSSVEDELNSAANSYLTSSIYRDKSSYVARLNYLMSQNNF
ncbi:membrane protein insertion efficiency factor YidD [Psychrobacter sp. 1U2]|uniref:membrane protein insertion efficiency factor YidD n=1 Tax=Psychrobacter sp. 1U2 TaxID=3453577 RepID=UPI003F46CC82